MNVPIRIVSKAQATRLQFDVLTKELGKWLSHEVPHPTPCEIRLSLYNIILWYLVVDDGTVLL